jgi:hypothetical protein
MSGQLNTLPTLPPEKKPSAYLVGGWVGPRPGPDILNKRKTLCLF